jgi:hypothetical protein
MGKLYVVRDATGRQWLCPSKPVLVGSPPNRRWEIKVSPIDTVGVCKENGCIMLGPVDALDRSCFDGEDEWKAYPVGIAL